jgi:transposase
MQERRELERRTRSRKLRVEDVRRARLILMLAAGESYLTIRSALRCDAGYVSRWKKRFETDRLAGLYARHQGSKPRALTTPVEARILAWTHAMWRFTLACEIPLASLSLTSWHRVRESLDQ